MPEGDQPATVVVASQVDDDRPQVCRGPFLVADPMGAPGESDEGFLDEVLRGGAVVDEQPGQREQSGALVAKQRGNEGVDRRDALQPCGRPGGHHTKSLHHFDRRRAGIAG